MIGELYVTNIIWRGILLELYNKYDINGIVDLN